MIVDQNVLDTVNGLFELMGTLFVLPSIYSVIKEKKVHGINWLTQLFFATWSVWNLFFYPQVHLSMSFYGAISLAVSQSTWLFLLIYYRKRTKEQEKNKSNVL